MHQLSRIFLLSLPGKVCLEKRRREIIEPKLVIPNAIFARAVALQTKFSLSNKFFEKSWKYAKDVYMCLVDLQKAYNLDLRHLESCVGRVNPCGLRIPAFAGLVREPAEYA